MNTILINGTIEEVSQNLSFINFYSIIKIIYITGTVYMLSKVIVGVVKIYIIHKSGTLDVKTNNLVLTKTTHAPFSFLNHIYINSIDIKNYTVNQKQALIEHENIHINEKHSLDNVFIAFIKIIFWWSPFIYYYQKALINQHEYIADSKAIDNTPKGNYIELLSNTIQKQHTVSFVNHFHHQLKNRLIMLLKKDTTQPTRFIYLWVLPLVVLLFFTVSCSKEIESKNNENIALNLETNPAKEMYGVVEEMPRFKGCETESTRALKKECAEKAMLNFIYKNVKYPTKAKDAGIEGVAVISFVVENTGKIINAKIVRNPGAGTGEESLRVINLMPDWIPGKQNGKIVSVEYKLPIKFKLQ